MKTKFEVGQLWRTREGERAMICQVDSADPDIGFDYPIIAFVHNNKVSYSKEGNYFCKDDYSEHKFDLIELIPDAGTAPTEVRDAAYLKDLWVKVWVETQKVGSVSDANYRARQAVAEFRKEFHAD